MKKLSLSLFVTTLSILILANVVFALGGKPPPKEEPKYKLEILKMELVTAPAQAKEKPTKEGEAKYKLEIHKTDVISTPTPSPEAKHLK